MVAATRSGPAPRLLADISSRSSTSPIATMIARAMSGNETTADAIAAATQVNTTSYAQQTVQHASYRPAAPQQQQQKETDGHRGQGQRQRYDGLDHDAPRDAPLDHQPAHGQRERHVDQRGDHRHLQRQQYRVQVHDFSLLRAGPAAPRPGRQSRQ